MDEFTKSVSGTIHQLLDRASDNTWLDNDMELVMLDSMGTDGSFTLEVSELVDNGKVLGELRRFRVTVTEVTR